MYNYQIKKYMLFGMAFSVGLCSYVLGIDLTDEISSRFSEAYDLGLADEYLNVPYDANYSKDPFEDAMKLYEGMSSQTKVAGVKYVESALALKGCGLSKEKQWAIEYYFLPEFRGEIARMMKMEMGDYASDNYVFDEKVIMNYCTEFYNCVNKSEGDADAQKITSGTPENVETNCKEFFQTNYREGQAEEKRVQNLQISWLGNDKYLNAITDESPYDVMKDLGVVGGLSYLQAQNPITPIFYDLPVFAKSKEALLGGKNGGGSDWVEETYGGIVPDGEVSLGGERVENDVAMDGASTADGSVKPLELSNRWLDDEYDALVEGLGAYRLNNDKSAYYGSLCKDKEEELEPELESQNDQDEEKPVSRDIAVGTESFTLTKVEYEELVDYMVDAVSSYTSLSKEKAQEIEKKAGDVSRYDGATTAEQTEAVAKKILNCYQSCVDLSIDEKFACMLKCSCGEIKSPIFDPEVNPGMGPIFMVRYCAVPAVNPRYFYAGSDGSDSWSSTLVSKKSSSGRGASGGGSSNGRSEGSSGGGNAGGSSNGGSAGGNSGGNGSSKEGIGNDFHRGGTTMVSMEKGSNEIYGVVDKLAREGRLGIWTQQYNFLDSSTKMMDIADSFSFTMSADKKNLGQKVGEPTEEYQKRVMKIKDDNWLVDSHVANPLDNPATRNRYRLVGDEGGGAGDILASVNASAARQSQGYLNVAPGFIVDQSENSDAARYAEISELFSDWMDEQGDFWDKKVDYLKIMDSYAKALYAKKG